MTEFEFLFALFALVMGLSLVELLSGLGRALEYKLGDSERAAQFTFGWLTPLLAVFVILDLLSFWIFAWPIRELVNASPLSVLGVMVLSGAYFLAARLVFPSDPEDFRDLDTHYFRVHRVVFAMLILMVVTQWIFALATPELRPLAGSPVAIGLTGILLALMAAAIWSKRKAASIVILALLILRYLATYAL